MWLLSLFCILICKYAESEDTTYGFSETETLFHPTTFQFFGTPLTHSFESPPVLFQSDIPIHKPHTDLPKDEENIPIENKKKDIEKKPLSVDPMYKPMPEINDITLNGDKDDFPPLFKKQTEDIKLPSKKQKTTSYGLPYEELESDKPKENISVKEVKRAPEKITRLKVNRDFFFNPKHQFSNFPALQSSFYESSFILPQYFEGFDWSDYEAIFNSKTKFPWSSDFKPSQPYPKETTDVLEVKTATSPPPLINKNTEMKKKLPEQADEFPKEDRSFG